jgi:MFS family permease
LKDTAPRGRARSFEFDRNARSVGPTTVRHIAISSISNRCMTSPHPKSSLPPTFQRLAWSNLAAQLAEQVGLAAAPLVAVLTLGAGEAATGILQIAQTLPFLLFSIPAGVWADRMPRARLMSRAELLRVMSLLVILALVTLGGLNLLLLAVLGFIGACGTVAFASAGRP